MMYYFELVKIAQPQCFQRRGTLLPSATVLCRSGYVNTLDELRAATGTVRADQAVHVWAVDADGLCEDEEVFTLAGA